MEEQKPKEEKTMLKLFAEKFSKLREEGKKSIQDSGKNFSSNIKKTRIANTNVNLNKKVKFNTKKLKTSYKQRVKNQKIIQQNEIKRRQFLLQQQLKAEEERYVSPNTQAIIDHIKNVQGKAERDDVNMQRIQRERRMVADTGNIMKTPFIFGKGRATLDITGTEGNILQSPNVFKENSDNFILKNKRLNILQTKEAGNDLKL